MKVRGCGGQPGTKS